MRFRLRCTPAWAEIDADGCQIQPVLISGWVGLAARDGLFEHDRFEPRRRGVDGRGEACRTCADNRDFARVSVVFNVDADRAGKLGEVRVDRHLQFRMPFGFYAAESDDGRRLLAEAGVDGPRLPVAIRYDGPGHHVAQLQCSRVAVHTHDSELLEPRPLLSGPRGQEVAPRPVHRFLVRPRPDEVIVGAPEGHRLNRRTGRRVVTIDEQHALGRWMQSVRTTKRVRGGASDQQHRYRLVDRGQLSQDTQRRRRRGLAPHPELVAKSPGKASEQRIERTLVVIDDEDHRRAVCEPHEQRLARGSGLPSHPDEWAICQPIFDFLPTPTSGPPRAGNR